MIICYVLIAMLTVAVVLLYLQELRSRAEISRKVESVKKELLELHFRLKNLEQGVVPGMLQRLEKLEDGIVPDFEEAKAAVKAVNDFNTGLAGIMGYDPMTAIKKTRQGEGEAE